MADALMVRKLIVRTLIWLGITGVLLFGSAGTLAWPQAWLFILEFGVLGLASGIAIARSDPELLRERMRSPVQRGQKSWDRALMIPMFAIWMAQYVVAGLDAVRFQTSDMPVWLNVAGAIAIAFGFYAFHVVMRANTFAAPVVRVQTERKHHVISTGPLRNRAPPDVRRRHPDGGRHAVDARLLVRARSAHSPSW